MESLLKNDATCKSKVARAEEEKMAAVANTQNWVQIGGSIGLVLHVYNLLCAAVSQAQLQRLLLQVESSSSFVVSELRVSLRLKIRTMRRGQDQAEADLR